MGSSLSSKVAHPLFPPHQDLGLHQHPRSEMEVLVGPCPQPNKVLLLYRVKNLNVFRLHSDGAINSMPHLEACIDDAIDRTWRKSIEMKLSRWMDVFDSEVSTGSVKFPNLAKLELGSEYWRFFPIFLQNADNFEDLITICTEIKYPKRWIEPKQVHACLLSHLGIVRIYNFECAAQEFNMIEYILRNAKVLKRMEIHLLWKISLFPRGSTECEIAFI